MSARSSRAAQCSAVEPSGSAASTGTRCRSKAVTLAALPLLTASITRVSAPGAAEPLAVQKTMSSTPIE